MSITLGKRLHIQASVAATALLVAGFCVAQTAPANIGNMNFTQPVTGTKIPTTLLSNVVRCPDEILLGSVRLASEWNMTPNTVKFASSRMLSPNVMGCTYNVSIYGHPVLITRTVSPHFKSCTANASGFICEKP
jgi:hypothetical protein